MAAGLWLPGSGRPARMRSCSLSAVSERDRDSMALASGLSADRASVRRREA